VNEIAMENIWENNFPQLGAGVLWDKLATEVVKITELYDFDFNDRFLITSCDPHIGNTFSLFTHFTLKRTQRMAFEKNA
jgi:hypothetical protein